MWHIQETFPGWLDSVPLLPGTAMIKATGNYEIFREVKAINPSIFTAHRMVRDDWQVYTGNSQSGWFDRATADQLARNWFDAFVDETFIRKVALYCDAVSWHNEIWANSQNDVEWAERVAAAEAAVRVWNNEYRPVLSRDIRLIIGEAAPGNWCPRRIAELAIESDNLMGYHPYDWWDYKVRRDAGWVAASAMLWDTMEHDWGLKPTWIFTEAGPLASATDGWRSSICLNGDRELYVEAVRTWIRDVHYTPAYAEGRIKGFSLFTTFGLDNWGSFHTQDPEMTMLAEMIAQEWKPGTYVPPPPPSDPDPQTFQEEAWMVTQQMQETGDGALQLNPGAGIQQTITAENRDGNLDLQVVTTERIVDGKTVQAAESLSGKVGRRVYVWEPGREVWSFENPFDVEFLILNVVDELPQHEMKVYLGRKPSQITTLTIHHTVGPSDQDIRNIAYFHTNVREWPGIGYHYVIDELGTIYQTNYLDTISYHVAGENGYSVGIAIQGDFTDKTPSQEQQDAVKWLVAYLRKLLGRELYVVPHREMPGAQTACPGNTYLSWIDHVQ